MNRKMGEMRIQEIPVEKIHPSPLQVRCVFDSHELKKLSESLKADGQLRPIMVRPHPRIRDEYEVVFGHRTLVAAKQAGLPTLLARIMELDDEEVMWIQWAENEYREDLSDYERARWLKKMIDEFGYTQRELEEKTGIDQTQISRLLKMLELEGFMPMGILKKVSERAVRPILSQPRELWPRIVEKIKAHVEEKGSPPTVSEVENIIWMVKMERELAEIALTKRPTGEETEKEATIEQVEERAEEETPQETPSEFIERTRKLWPGVTDEFLVNSLTSHFNLSEAEAREELQAYYREKYGPSTPKVSAPRDETVKCPVCGRATAPLDIQFRIEELRENEPELRAWEWLLREVEKR